MLTFSFSQIVDDFQIRRFLPFKHLLSNLMEENNTRYKVLQQKYDRRVLEEDGCLLPKGMWGHPFNSRCTIVTMATIGNYQPNDLILDWGSGCGHQATTMTRLNCNFSRPLHLCIIQIHKS